MPRLIDALELRGRKGRSRVVFGPHETNLGRGRCLSARHVAYYERRAQGGAGVIVVEAASVHASDWPYERAPLADSCTAGWTAIADACRPHGSLVLAGLAHCGNQGSSAWSQSAMWGASRVADVVSRELPMAMEQGEIDALLQGFRNAARAARAAGLDGVEIDAGSRSLLRQFLSPITNQRADRYGADRPMLLREVLAAARAELGEHGILGLRLSCDELAPWAGIVPERAAEIVRELAVTLDLLTVTRGGPYSATSDRPDSHEPAMFNVDLCRSMRDAAGGSVTVVLQGSVVDGAAAQAALDDGVADAVEMTRAQIADADLVRKLRDGTVDRVRPCILCNQACRVRDNRNPRVSCVADPHSGYESDEPAVDGVASCAKVVLVVGAGTAGLECARVLATRGHRVRLVEARERTGGVLRLAPVATNAGIPVLDVLDVFADGIEAVPAGRVVIHDPVGGPVGIAAAELLASAGRSVALVTPDSICGQMLGMTGDLAAANVRLQRVGVARELRALPRGVAAGQLTLQDVWTGAQRVIDCDVLIDAGHRLPQQELYEARPGTWRAGDAVAPRSVLEAVLDGRRRALDVEREDLQSVAATGASA